MKRTVAAAALVAILGSVSAAAAPSDPLSIQLSWFPVRAITDDGRSANAVVIAHLRVAAEAEIQTVCRWMPRIRDAILVTLQAEAIRRHDRRLDLGGAEVRLADAIHRATRSAVVVDVALVEWTRSTTTAIGTDRSFSDVKCRQIEIGSASHTGDSRFAFQAALRRAQGR